MLYVSPDTECSPMQRLRTDRRIGFLALATLAVLLRRRRRRPLRTYAPVIRLQPGQRLRNAEE